MPSEETINPDITEGASDPLGAPDSQEENDDDWSPQDLSPEQREQYDRAVKAADEFVTKHPEYKPTDENQQMILDYLAVHDLLISPASLELCWEQLRDRLDLAPEEESNADESIRVRLATAQLARGTKSEEESPESDESEPEEEPIGQRGKPIAWRNGQRVRLGVGG